ncbi:MAG: hypothetical protein WCT77_02575 [Bacteroidota bacterium]
MNIKIFGIDNFLIKVKAEKAFKVWGITILIPLKKGKSIITDERVKIYFTTQAIS